MVFAAISQASSLRASYLFGFGVGVSSEAGYFVESPVGMAFMIDYTYSRKMSLGVDHLRTWGLSPVSSSISFTNLNFKYYFIGEIPTIGKDYSIDDQKSVYFANAMSWYLGTSLGFGQSSVIPAEGVANASTSGLGAGLKMGFDYNMFRRMGFRGEGSLTTTVMGEGSLAVFLMVFGFYYAF